MVCCSHRNFCDAYSDSCVPSLAKHNVLISTKGVIVNPEVKSAYTVSLSIKAEQGCSLEETYPEIQSNLLIDEKHSTDEIFFVFISNFV